MNTEDKPFKWVEIDFGKTRFTTYTDSLGNEYKLLDYPGWDNNPITYKKPLPGWDEIITFLKH